MHVGAGHCTFVQSKFRQSVEGDIPRQVGRGIGRARWLLGELRSLILEEPTRGVDVGARQEIYRHIRALAGQGIGILIISSDAVQYSLVDYAGKLIDRFSEGRSHDPAGAPAFAAAVKEGLERILQRSRISQERVLLISISSKGLVNAAEPVLLWSPIFGTDRIDFESLLRPEWQARVILDNETLLVAAALGAHEENVKGADFRSLAALSLGHSIGLGIVRRGANGGHETSAPNFGHMLHTPNGGLCRCGTKGCIEAYAADYGVLRTAYGVPDQVAPAASVPTAAYQELVHLAQTGRRNAIHAFNMAGRAIGFGLSRLLTIAAPAHVVITGPGANAFELMRSEIDLALKDSLVARINGAPSITVQHDEREPIFQGMLMGTLNALDEMMSVFPNSEQRVANLR